MRNFQTVVMLKRFLILGILIHVTWVPSQLFAYPITITTLDQGNFILDADSSDSIQDIKDKVWGYSGRFATRFIPDFQRLVYAGKTLENDKILSDYDIQKDSNIHLVIRGGLVEFSNAVSFGGGYTLFNGYDIKVLSTPSSIGVMYPYSLTRSLTFSPALEAPHIFNIQSVDIFGASSYLSNFDYTTEYTVPILTATGGIINFNPAQVSVNTSGFSNSLGGGAFSLVQSNSTTLSLQFTPAAIPEPSTYGFCGVGAIGLMFFLRRKKSNQS